MHSICRPATTLGSWATGAACCSISPELEPTQSQPEAQDSKCSRQREGLTPRAIGVSSRSPSRVRLPLSDGDVLTPFANRGPKPAPGLMSASHPAACEALSIPDQRVWNQRTGARRCAFAFLSYVALSHKGDVDEEAPQGSASQKTSREALRASAPRKIDAGDSGSNRRDEAAGDGDQSCSCAASRS